MEPSGVVPKPVFLDSEPELPQDRKSVRYMDQWEITQIRPGETSPIDTKRLQDIVENEFDATLKDAYNKGYIKIIRNYILYLPLYPRDIDGNRDSTWSKCNELYMKSDHIGKRPSSESASISGETMRVPDPILIAEPELPKSRASS